jgi:Bcr/CflA subfamily drug resistance transporter
MYLPAFPSIMREFAVSESIVQLTLSSWLLGDGLAQLIFGPLSDRIGRRPVIFGGGFVFILSCIGCIYVRDMNLFIIIRFFQGAAVCSVGVAGYAAIHESFEDSKAVRLIAMMSIIVVLAPMLGPIVGGYIVTYHNWQMIFTIVMWINIVAMTGLYFAMPETLVNKNHNSMSISNLKREYKEIVLNKEFMRYCLIFGLTVAGIIAWIATSPVYLMIENKFSPEEFGLAQIPVFGGFILGALIIRLCVDKISLQALLKLGLLICCSGSVIVLATAVIDQKLTNVVIVGMSIYGTGFATMASPVARLAFNSTSGGKGVVNAVYSSSMLLMSSFVTLAISVIDCGGLIVFAVLMNLMMIMSLAGTYWRNKALP